MSAHIATQSGVQVTNDDTPASAAAQPDNRACQDAADLTTISQHNRSINTGTNIIFAGPLSGTTASEQPDLGDTASGMNYFVVALGQSQPQMLDHPNPLMNRYIIHEPAILPGVRCYADASTPPDQLSLTPKMAGLGIFFVNTQVQLAQTIYIKAVMTSVDSVLMAEAAALALAATVNDRLNFNNTSFLSDCQQLVQFLNAADHSNPPDWKIKFFTQLFVNHSQNRGSNIYKISRTLNRTADTLAKQAYTLSQSNSTPCEPVLVCPVLCVAREPSCPHTRTSRATHKRGRRWYVPILLMFTSAHCWMHCHL